MIIYPQARHARLFIFMIVIVTTSLFPTPKFLAFSPESVQAQNACDGLVAPRLTVDHTARVVTEYGLSLKNQAATGAAGATELTQMPYGIIVTVIDGPACGYGYVWWQVRLPDGTTGWAVEGSGEDYFLEPITLGLHVYQSRNEGAQLAHYFVTPDGVAQPQGTFTILPEMTTAQAAWQQVEIDWFSQTLAALRERCPDRLTGTPWEIITNPEEALQQPLPALEYDYYPAPDGNRVLLVRHQHQRVPQCRTVVPERAGISTVSVLNLDGSETLLFPFPQHGSVPNSIDVYTGSEPSEWNVFLDQVSWSPRGKHIAFVVGYRYLCNRQDCYRYHLYVSNLETEQLYILGEGRHVSWTSGGEGLNFFRVITGAGGNQNAHLYTARPDGTARQEIWLPGGAIYASGEQQALGFPWDEGGTRVMVANGGLGEVMLFNLTDRAFTPPVVLPEQVPPINRLSVHLIQGGDTFFWSTIRGEFFIQNAQTGDWVELNSELASTGVAPRQVRPFAVGNQALIEMSDNTAYILNTETDQLRAVTFVQ